MKYQTKDSAACDLESQEYFELEPGETKVVSTGVYLSQFGELPENVCFFVLSRSGLAAKYGIHVLNSPGLIDADFPGEIKVILHNSGKYTHPFGFDDRIAQLIMVPFMRIPGVPVAEEVRTGGLGSTGV